MILVPKTVCFFSHVSRAQLQKQQYSIQDMRILDDLGHRVIIATTFGEIPWNCDLYFSWFAAGSILPVIKARLAGKPVIVVAGGNDSMFYHDSITGTPLGYLAAPWYKKVAARLSLRLATVVLTVSQFMIENVSSLGARSPIVVPNSVDTSLFQSSDVERLFVTTMFDVDEIGVRIKRGEVFLRAIPAVLTQFPDQTFVVIGENGNAYQRMLALTTQLGINESVRFLGSIENKEAAEWLRRSKVYVQISDTETFGVAIAEAMSTETPVVVSRRGAIPEVAGDHAVFVDHNEPASVAAGIIELLSKSDEERRRIGAAARSRVIEHFSYEKRRAAIQKIIQPLLGTGNRNDSPAGSEQQNSE